MTADDRRAAVERLCDALDDFHIEGLVTSLPLLRKSHHEDFRTNQFHTKWLEQTLLPAFEANTEILGAAAMAHVEFLDETMRDGQSLWGMRMQANGLRLRRPSIAPAIASI